MHAVQRGWVEALAVASIGWRGLAHLTGEQRTWAALNRYRFTVCIPTLAESTHAQALSKRSCLGLADLMPLGGDQG